MDTATSADGTPIAFERLGDGPPLILVGGALCDRASTRPLAERLERRFTVINYDRRGRGDSGDTAPYAAAREVEDVGALVAEAGGTAAVYGHSSGAAIALRAAAHGLAIDRLILHEPPYAASVEEQRESRRFAEDLHRLLEDDRRSDALELFLSIVGMPPEALRQMKADPWWADAEALAPTLAYDSAVMGDSGGGTIPTDLLGRVTAPTLVVCGGASPASMIDAGRRVAEGVPDGRVSMLEGQEHVVAPELLAPVLEEFLAG